MRKLKYIIASMLVVTTLIQCDALVGDPELPIPLDETLANTGAFLRVLSVESSGFDVADLSAAAYTFTGEIQDVNNGADVERVEFYVAFAPADRTNPGVDEPSAPIKTYTKDQFTTREASGLPSAQFSVTLNEILSYLSLTLNDLSLGDNFEIRWVLVTNDGTEYTNTEASPAVTGGFYQSPYFARAGVVQSIPETIFLGEYTFTQLNNGATFNPLFGATFTGELQINPSNTLNGRIIRDVAYLPEFGGFNFDMPFTFFRFQDFQAFTAADNWVSFPGTVDPSVGCGIGLVFNNVPDNTKSSFDVDDDSQFTFTIIDNANTDCGGAPAEVQFSATKN